MLYLVFALFDEAFPCVVFSLSLITDMMSDAGKNFSSSLSPEKINHRCAALLKLREGAVRVTAACGIC